MACRSLSFSLSLFLFLSPSLSLYIQYIYIYVFLKTSDGFGFCLICRLPSTSILHHHMPGLLLKLYVYLPQDARHLRLHHVFGFTRRVLTDSASRIARVQARRGIA